jgi:heme O synthase-like polyprenyltransferase
MNGHAVPRFPQLEPVRDDLNRLKITWGLCCASPILYLLFSQFIQQTFFSAHEMGFAQLPFSQYRFAVIGAACAALAIQALMFYVRRRHESEMRRTCKSAAQLLKVYSRSTFKLMLLSEAVVIFGFILFLLNGQSAVLLAFGIAGMVFYAQSYPSEGRLGSIARTL